MHFSYGNSADLSCSFNLPIPLSLVRAGYYNYGNGGLGGRGTEGDYWESKAHPTATYAYILNFNSTNLDPQNNGTKGNGRSIHCLDCFLFSPTSALHY